jgi:hypothetical protein
MMWIFAHEYSLVMYGVILWQVEQWLQSRTPFRGFLPTAARNIGRSMIWVGLIVVFDDELLAQYNSIAHVDYQNAPFWMYMVAGFAVDIVRGNFTKVKSEKSN